MKQKKKCVYIHIHIYTTDFSTIKIQSARNKIDEICFFVRVPYLYYAIYVTRYIRFNTVERNHT